MPAEEQRHSIYSRLPESTHAGLASAAPYLLPALQTGGTAPARPTATGWSETRAVRYWRCWAADDSNRRLLVDGNDLSTRHAPKMGRVGLAVE